VRVRQPAMRSIVLTGFMATGKTEVGREVARRLGRPFVDTDRLIEEAAGIPVPAIFARHGEAHFRTLEREAVARACAVSGAVVATGGGTMLDPENRRRLKAAGPVICLAADADTIAARVGSGVSRPLLADGGDVRTRIGELLAAREAAYAAADRRVDTSQRSVTGVADAIVELVGELDLG
jgi:shikimate kinase